MLIPSTLYHHLLNLLIQIYNIPVDTGDVKGRELQRKIGNIIKKLEKIKL